MVETPYLGMEHQSAVAYGNQYMKGYLGRDLSGTGIGLEWDYIIIHESGCNHLPGLYFLQIFRWIRS